MSVCLAREELMWKCLLRKRGLLPCQHAIAMHMLNPFVLQPCTRGEAEELKTQVIVLIGEEQSGFYVPKVWHLLSLREI